MKKLKEYNRLKNYTADLQRTRLRFVADFIANEFHLDLRELLTKTRKRAISEARRKIAFLSRICFNIDGTVMANYFEMNNECICQLIYTCWDYCNVDQGYYREIQELMSRLQIKYMYSNVTLKPMI